MNSNISSPFDISQKGELNFEEEDFLSDSSGMVSFKQYLHEKRKVIQLRLQLDELNKKYQNAELEHQKKLTDANYHLQSLSTKNKENTEFLNGLKDIFEIHTKAFPYAKVLKTIQTIYVDNTKRHQIIEQQNKKILALEDVIRSKDEYINNLKNQIKGIKEQHEQLQFSLPIQNFIEDSKKKQNQNLEQLKAIIDKQSAILEEQFQNIQQNLSEESHTALFQKLIQELKQININLQQRVNQLEEQQKLSNQTCEKNKELFYDIQDPSTTNSNSNINDWIWMAQTKQLLSLERKIQSINHQASITECQCQYMARESLLSNHQFDSHSTLL